MIVKCTNCETKYKLDPAKFSTPEPKIRCKKCNTVFKAVEESAAPAAAAPKPAAEKPPAAAQAPAPVADKPAPQAAAAPAAPSGGGKLVVFGHESTEVTEMATELLEEAGYEVSVAHDGIQALMQIESRHPAVAVLDVALPKMFGFEVVEVVRRDDTLAAMKILLIAAIYDKTRYKRNPVSLYGADDYVEKHMIPEEIVEKVNGLLSGAPASAGRSEAAPAPAAPTAPAAKPAQVPLPPKPAAPAAPAASGIDEASLSPEEKEDHEKAKRLARIIASDVALYNADALTEGLRNGNPLDALQGDIDEGRKLFVERVPASMRDRYDYVGAALEDLFEKKRKELGIGV